MSTKEILPPPLSTLHPIIVETPLGNFPGNFPNCSSSMPSPDGKAPNTIVAAINDSLDNFIASASVSICANRTKELKKLRKKAEELKKESQAWGGLLYSKELKDAVAELEAFLANDSSTEQPEPCIEVNDRVKVLWSNGRYYQGIAMAFTEGDDNKKVKVYVEYDDNTTGSVDLYLCQKYSGLLPPEGLYFTEGDPVVVESTFGSNYNEIGRIVEIETWHTKRYVSPQSNKQMSGPFGTFKVLITEGANKGHVLHGIGSDDLRRRANSSGSGNGRSLRLETVAMETGTVQSISSSSTNAPLPPPVVCNVSPLPPPPPPRPFQIFVQFNKTITLTVNPTSTIENLKRQIKEKEGIPLQTQRLYLHGKPLHNDYTLLEYNIQRGNTIQLNTHFSSQAPPPTTPAPSISIDTLDGTNDSNSLNSQVFSTLKLLKEKTTRKKKMRKVNKVLKKAIKSVTRAVAFDQQEDYTSALTEYESSILIFNEYLKGENNTSTKQVVQKRVNEYKARMKMIQSAFNNNGDQEPPCFDDLPVATEVRFVGTCSENKGEEIAMIQSLQAQILELESSQTKLKSEKLAADIEKDKACAALRRVAKLRNEQKKKEQKEQEEKEQTKQIRTWECETDHGWIAYEPALQQQFENAHDLKLTEFDFERRYGNAKKTYRYSVNFCSNKQKNLDTNIERNIKARLHDVPTTTDGLNGWSTQGETIGNNIVVHRITKASLLTGGVTKENDEFLKAAGQFELLSQKGSSRVHTVEVYENPNMNAKYAAKKEEFRRKGHSTDQVWVFHGTPDVHNIRKIMTSGFLVGGKEIKVAHGTAYGQGIYTAVGPNTPGQYVGSAKQMILAQALVGKNGGRKGQNGGDSWRPKDDWYVFRHGSQVLPRYVVHWEPQ